MGMAETLPLADSWGMHGDVGAGWWVVMMVLMVVFWGTVIVGIFWLVRGATSGRSASGERLAVKEGPMEILDRRFAEGEINAEDYRARREVLAGGAPGAGGAEE